MTWGKKTAKGVYNTIERLAQMMRDGETIKP
jgi:hypothetical protein